MEAIVYNQQGKEANKVALEAKVFGLPWNTDLVAQVVEAMRDNARSAIANTKDRGEVRGGGKKPWRQKGTGRARHGSSRSPIWVGGGVAHGPTNEVNYRQKINKRMKTKALWTILSKKYKDGEVVFVDSLELGGKTKKAQDFLDKMAKISGLEKVNFLKGRRALIVTPSKVEDVASAFANIKSSQVAEARNINPRELMTYKYVLFVSPEESLAGVTSRSKAPKLK